MPLDWPIRFAFVGGLYYLLRCRRWSHRTACALTLAILLGKELFDIVAHRNPLSPRAPDWGDAADVLSGLAGLGAAICLFRMRTKHRATRNFSASG